MINTVNYSLEEGEAGIILPFLVPPSALKPKDQYILYFDSPVTLPENPPTTVTFEPSSGSYVIFGNKNVKPKVLLKIKSIHRSETKTLVRLTIKDDLNTTLYMDYVLVVCTPQSTIELPGSLLPTTTSGNIGPRGGSIIRLSSGNNINTSQLDIGMSIKGPGLVSSSSAVSQYYIVNILSSTDIEIDRLVSSNVGFSGTYQFIRSVGCVDATTLLKRTSTSSYMVLDSTNNWTYKVNNKLIAKFIPYSPTYEDMASKITKYPDLVVLLPIKNSSLLTASDDPLPIPDISIIKIGGRVMRDTVCVSEALGS